MFFLFFRSRFLACVQFENLLETGGACWFPILCLCLVFCLYLSHISWLMVVSDASYMEGECNRRANPTLVRNSSQTAHCEWPGTLRALRRVPKKNAVGGLHRIGNRRLWNFALAGQILQQSLLAPATSKSSNLFTRFKYSRVEILIFSRTYKPRPSKNAKDGLPAHFAIQSSQGRNPSIGIAPLRPEQVGIESTGWHGETPCGTTFSAKPTFVEEAIVLAPLAA